jgi:minor histocompatibility antigen H13
MPRPLMITVATSLDVPIKLVIPGPQRGSMLGLGDVVLPGIQIALALRFDLYLHYLRLQKKGSVISSLNPPQTESTVIKAPYQDATSTWGERFWTRSASKEDKAKVGGRFSKVYFTASLVGYIIGLIVTLVVLNIFKHGQPALLYLVPGVLIAQWGTAAVRGELGLMWNYSEMWVDEDESKDNKDDKNSKDEQKSSSGQGEEKRKEGRRGSLDEHAHHVFLFSLSTPSQAPPTVKLVE